MNLIVGNKFKIKGIEYVVTGVEMLGYRRHKVFFKSTNWDKEVLAYQMKAEEFDLKIKPENYVYYS